MKKILASTNKFGSHAEFEAYELNLVRRKKTLPIPSSVKLSDEDIPADDDILFIDYNKLNEYNVALSRRFRLKNLVSFNLNRVSDGVRPVLINDEGIDIAPPRHYYSNKVVYHNLQRLCHEVLEPLMDFAGTGPNIEFGLMYRENLDGVKPDTFFSDQLKGNAVALNFPDQSDGFAYRVFEYLVEFCLYDRIIMDLKNFDIPTIKISVNEKNRRLAYVIRK